jgi:ubiquinone/menaquinone biosynthesis C-methylase UbiE
LAENRTGPENSLAYTEKPDSLSIRVEAHKRFSNFSLEDWLEINLPCKKGDVILDLGCGNGNLFTVYHKKITDTGVIVGIDQSSALLLKAREGSKVSSKVLIEWDMNQPLPFITHSFDFVISTFAIYYVENVSLICKEINRVLKPKGEVFLIGPKRNNANELYDFNERVFNFRSYEKVERRTNRLENEFYPTMRGIFPKCSMEEIKSKLIFPDKHEFVRYYMATLLYEESIAKASFKPDREYLLSINLFNFEISKEIIVLKGKKH